MNCVMNVSTCAEMPEAANKLIESGFLKCTFAGLPPIRIKKIP